MNCVSCLGLTRSVIGLLSIGGSGPGHQLGLWGFKTGSTLVKYAGYISVAALVVCLVGLALRQSQVFPQGMISALVGLVIGGCVLGLTLKWKHTLASLPYIHDITTDTTRWFRFKEDVVVRLSPSPVGSPSNNRRCGHSIFGRLRSDGHPERHLMPGEQARQKNFDPNSQQG